MLIDFSRVQPLRIMLMSEHQFPSGPWVGFFTCPGIPSKSMMDLMLEFKNGVMTGEGADWVGRFVISGHYSEQSGECGWVKQYVGQHAVNYKGYRDGKGIWGNWALYGAKGGFHIWPLSEGGVANVETESEPEAQPASHQGRLARN